MPAVITDTLKRQIARDFFDQFSLGTANYYVGIGRSEQWDSFETVPTPTNNPETQSDFRDGLQSIKRMQGSSLVAPRNNWSNGRIYSPYDDRVQGYPTLPYYVKTDNNQVYVCLEVGRNKQGVAQPSTVEPTGSNIHSFRTADGYVWKFMYTISAADQEKFQSSNFIPVKLQGATDSNSTGIELKQAEVQDHAISGAVLSIVLTSNGQNYTSNPTVTIGGFGTGASASAVIDSATGEVTRIQMDPDSSTLAHGSGYSTATVTISGGGGSGATARAILPFSDSGVGADPRVDLKSSAVMFHTMIEGTDSNFYVNQDFRQIGLLKNPRDKNGNLFTNTTGNALNHMTLSSIVTNFTVDKILEGQTSNAQAYVDFIDSNEIYYHQTDETGFTPFQDGEVIEELNGAGQGIIDSSLIQSQVDKQSGDLLYIDNRAPVSRTTSQAEDIKVIIQF
tara:strand:+ start:9822 stop:11168 length:1347 start_codon:yes stop_codon:yes gene_type:complete